MWIPGHVGIEGNDRADFHAKEAALRLGTSEIPILHSDFSVSIKRILSGKWSLDWDVIQLNKLRSVKFHIGEWSSSNRVSRREEVVLSRLRIGHTLLTHKHLFDSEPPPHCNACDADVTVEHVLIHCKLYDNQRKAHFSGLLSANKPLTVHDVLAESQEFRADSIFSFLKDIDVFNKL